MLRFCFGTDGLISLFVTGIQPLGDENSSNGMERTATLPIPGTEPGPNLAMRSSFDITASRRSAVDGDNGRDHASRIIQKLDLHRKSTIGPQVTGAAATSSPSSVGVGGIASLISASHNVMPIGPGFPPPAPEVPVTRPASTNTMRDLPFSTLAPNALATPLPRQI